MVQCARCIASSEASPLGSRLACPSCNWRLLQRRSDESSPAWQSFYGRLIASDEDDAARRLRLFAMLAGEDGEASVDCFEAAWAAGDVARYQGELLRLAEKLLERIDEL